MEKKKINIIEVGPRDGFQSVRGDFIPTELKKEIIDLLVDARREASGVHLFRQPQGHSPAG